VRTDAFRKEGLRLRGCLYSHQQFDVRTDAFRKEGLRQSRLMSFPGTRAIRVRTDAFRKEGLRPQIHARRQRRLTPVRTDAFRKEGLRPVFTSRSVASTISCANRCLQEGRIETRTWWVVSSVSPVRTDAFRKEGLRLLVCPISFAPGDHDVRTDAFRKEGLRLLVD